jgi:hypothetical protein
VLARTGRDIAEYRYGPLTFDGGGVVGPPGGKSGAPRPIADAAFCYVPRKAVDLGLGSFSLPSLQVGVPGTFVVMVANSGYEEALGVSLMITPDAGARLHSCGDQTGAEDRCSLGGVAPDSVVPVEFDLVAGSDGEGKVSIEVRALNESPDAVSDNLLVLRYRVDATSPTRSPAVSSPAVPGGTNAPEELPLTGPGHGLLWLAVLATVLVGGGVLITATGRSGG